MIDISAVPTTSHDLLVVNAARVSFAKQSTNLSEKDRNLIRFLYRQSHWTPFGHPHIAFALKMASYDVQQVLLTQQPGAAFYSTNMGKGSERLIVNGSLWYWLTNLHLYPGFYQNYIRKAIHEFAPVTAALCFPLESDTPQRYVPEFIEPFEITDDWVAEDPTRAKLATMTFKIDAPFPIRTQLFKHKHGFIENEVSRRYVDGPNEYFLPEIWRQRAEHIKQGSEKTPVNHPWLVNLIARTVYKVSDWGYNAALYLGVCPEQARFLTSQGAMTQWYWTGTLDALHRMYRLRTDPHAQEETCLIASKLASLTLQRWPKTWTQMSSNSSVNSTQK